MKYRTAIVATAAVVLSQGTPVYGTGFRLPDQDAFATARGEAFVATADNPSAIYYNPAGLTDVEGQGLRGGVYGLYFNPRYTSPTTGVTYNNLKDVHAIPQAFYSWTMESMPLSLGLGAYSAYGLSSAWDQDTGFRTIATEGSITSFTINPTLAYKVLPTLSLGAGLRVNYMQIDLQQGLLWPMQPYDKFRFKGDAWALSYDVGLMWRPLNEVSLGAAFKSKTSFDTQGSTEYANYAPWPNPGSVLVPAMAFPSQDAQANFDFPLNVVCGLSYRPNSNWNFEFNADYTDWSCLGTVEIRQSNGVPGLIPQTIPIELDWRASWYYELGATRYLGHGWCVSAGYIYNQNSVTDAHYNPLVADLNRHFFSVGTGHKGEHFAFDIAYQFGYGPTRTVTGSAPSAIGQTADGDYQYFSHAVFLTAGWHF